jgi:beta-phosphoglucomutase
LNKLNLTTLFNAIIDGNNIKNAKPNPEVFLKAAQSLNIPPENCVVFEDAQAGIEAAKAANMKCVGIGSPDILKNADLVVSGLDKINVNILQKLCR